jgi:type I restriction enzyme S subunit
MVNEQGIPKGYKKTEVGVIPKDWDIKRLGDIAVFLKGSGLSKSDLSPDGMKRCIHYGELFTIYEERIDAVVNGTDLEGDFVLSQKNDVLMPTSDVTPNGLATASCIKISNVVLGGDILIIRAPETELSGEFLAYLVKVYRNRVMQMVKGTTVFHLHARDMANFVLPVPCIEEQRAIAAALSDVDGLLSALDALIAKKRALKTAAMQSLLTGRIRLPGFTGEWVTRRLGDVAELLKGHGLSKSTLEPDGQWFCILYGELFTTYKEVITNVKSRTNIRYQGLFSLAGDVLLPGSTTTTGVDLAKASALLLSNILLGSDIIVVRQKENANAYDASFLAYSLTYVYKHKIAQKTKGITIYHLHGKDLVDLEVTLPSIDEQRAIAAVLADMDAEIAALEARREKVRQVKQGMMQVLLTGKVRLVNKDNAV